MIKLRKIAEFKYYSTTGNIYPKKTIMATVQFCTTKQSSVEMILSAHVQLTELYVHDRIGTSLSSNLCRWFYAGCYLNDNFPVLQLPVFILIWQISIYIFYVSILRICFIGSISLINGPSETSNTVFKSWKTVKIRTAIKNSRSTNSMCTSAHPGYIVIRCSNCCVPVWRVQYLHLPTEIRNASLLRQGMNMYVNFYIYKRPFKANLVKYSALSFFV